MTRKLAFSRRILIAAPLISAGLALIMAATISWFGLWLKFPEPREFLGAKLAFLSMLMALGMFQYKFFYDENRELMKGILEENFPGWKEAINKLHEIGREIEGYNQEHPQRVAAADEQALNKLSAERDALYKQNQELAEKIRSAYKSACESMIKNSFYYGLRLALIFIVGFSILISLGLDLLTLYFPIANEFFRLMSQTAFVSGILEFTVLIFLFVLAVRRNMIDFSDFAQQRIPN